MEWNRSIKIRKGNKYTNRMMFSAVTMYVLDKLDCFTFVDRSGFNENDGEYIVFACAQGYLKKNYLPKYD